MRVASLSCSETKAPPDDAPVVVAPASEAVLLAALGLGAEGAPAAVELDVELPPDAAALVDAEPLPDAELPLPVSALAPPAGRLTLKLRVVGG